MTPDQNKALLEFIKCQKPRLEHNRDVIAIQEGELLAFVEAHFKKEFSSRDSVEQVMPRIAPINFLTQIIDKLSKIYQDGVKRTVIDGNESDEELLRWYEKVMQMNSVMNVGNEYFNTFKSNLNQIFISNRKPKLRAIPNDRFMVYSNNKIDPLIPTHIIMPMGQKQKPDQRYKNKYRSVDEYVVWTDTEAYLLDSEGVTEPFLDSGDFSNPLGLDIFMYVNKSSVFIQPPIDSDTFRMTVLLAVLISDMNYAAKFQTFSLMYGIDIDDQNIEWKPNGIMLFKSDPESDKPPQLGQISPQAKIDQMIKLITTELSLWLRSKNIKSSAIGDLNADNAASGIAKIVDEADTSDARKKQVEFYKAAEGDFWKALINNVHPLWVNEQLIDQTVLFSSSAMVVTEFPPQIPLVSRGTLVKDLLVEIEGGLLSLDSAMKVLHPEWSEEEIDKEKQKIAEQGEVIVNGG